jgi:hypothetical protein
LIILGPLGGRGQVFTVGFFNSEKIQRTKVVSQEKGLPGEPIKQEIVRKMERFPKCSLFK